MAAIWPDAHANVKPGTRLSLLPATCWLIAWQIHHDDGHHSEAYSWLSHHLSGPEALIKLPCRRVLTWTVPHWAWSAVLVAPPSPPVQELGHCWLAAPWPAASAERKSARAI